MSEYINSISLNFSKFLYEKYLDKAADLKGRVRYDVYENQVNEFCEKLILFKQQFGKHLENILRKDGKVVYSNTPFVVEYNYEISELFEELAHNILDMGIFDDLCKNIKFVLNVNHEKANLYVEQYCFGERKCYDVFSLQHKDFVQEIE